MSSSSFVFYARPTLHDPKAVGENVAEGRITFRLMARAPARTALMTALLSAPRPATA